MKSVQIRRFFWSVFSRIQTEYRKIRTRKNSVFGHSSRSAPFTKIVRRKLLSRPIPYYHNSTSAWRIKLPGDMELNDGPENPNKHSKGKPWKSQDRRLQFPKFARKLYELTRNDCHVYIVKTKRIFYTAVHITLWWRMWGLLLWTYCECYFRELPFASLSDIKDVKENSDLPSSATYDINIHDEKHCVKGVQIRSFSWSVFSCIRTEYVDLRSKSPYSVRIKENQDQRKLSIWALFTLKNSEYVKHLSIAHLNTKSMSSIEAATRRCS